MSLYPCFMELKDSKQCKYVLVNLVNYIIILMCFACACWTLSVDWRRQLSTVYILNKLWLVDKTIQNSYLFPKICFKDKQTIKINKNMKFNSNALI